MNHFQAQLADQHQAALRQRHPDGPRSARVLLLAQGAVGRRAAELLAKLPLRTLTVQALLPEDVAALQQQGGRVFSQAWRGKNLGLQTVQIDLLALAVERPFPLVLEQINRHCQRTGLPWTQVTQWGAEIILGPSVLPGASACYECYVRRLRANELRLDLWEARDNFFRAEPSAGLQGQISPLVNQAASLLSIEVGRLLGAGPAPASLGHELIWNLFANTHSANPVVPVEHCPVCGADQALNLEPSASLDAVIERMLLRQQEPSHVER